MLGFIVSGPEQQYVHTHQESAVAEALEDLENETQGAHICITTTTLLYYTFIPRKKCMAKKKRLKNEEDGREGGARAFGVSPVQLWLVYGTRAHDTQTTKQHT